MFPWLCPLPLEMCMWPGPGQSDSHILPAGGLLSHDPIQANQVIVTQFWDFGLDGCMEAAFFFSCCTWSSENVNLVFLEAIWSLVETACLQMEPTPGNADVEDGEVVLRIFELLDPVNTQLELALWFTFAWANFLLLLASLSWDFDQQPKGPH